jgi:hypothetical protein
MKNKRIKKQKFDRNYSFLRLEHRGDLLRSPDIAKIHH